MQAKYLYRTLTWPEVNEAVKANKVILIPVAAIEQHGLHLPLDTDNLATEYVCEEAARRCPEVLLCAPPIHYGFNEHNMGFPGVITVREEHFLGYCYDVGESFVRQGFKKIIYVNGHGSNAIFLNIVARQIVNRTDALAAALSYWSLAKEAVDKVRESEYPGGMAHACEFETSIYLYLKPELVQQDKMRVEYPTRRGSGKIYKYVYCDLMGSGPVHLIDRWNRISEYGVEGDPTKATPEKGRMFTECAIENLIELAKEFQQLPILPEKNLMVRNEHRDQVK